ncbi:hypothetical protein E5357_06130 [Hominisplanchenecus murintestinalis]|uniref:Uncharacterized protein n=1 Tax=Hominisplanchenecus murintestinalis TaxID=2941517 RepID=A0AC61R031_9FIRM|nr:major tail protein [Hominisplanchenecus murintestinalis]TGX99186.1 hypothetical protein E5357_06130 [Hominisplanchenecus murintestinalis]
MAKKGIEYTVFGILQEDGSYKDGKYLSPVANFNGTPNKSNVVDYGDDRALETDNSVTGGTLSIEMNNDDEETYTFLLGHKKDEETGEIIYDVNDIPPYVGCGAIGTSGKKKVVKFYTKVQFGEPNDENTTRQESTTFNHSTLEGTILIPEDGVWKIRKEFDTLKEAKAWLNEKVGITGAGGAGTLDEEKGA